jgi:aminoglycoside 6'-N-acetyltransferase I
MAEVSIRNARPQDRAQVAAFCADLWPDGTAEEHGHDLDRIFAGTYSALPIVVLVAEEGDRVIGFIEVSLRSTVDGCDPLRPAGYIEGWYVIEARRKSGVGRRLVEAAEAWARREGAAEMGSDALIDNDLSQQAHSALGYEVVDRCVNYRKLL